MTLAVEATLLPDGSLSVVATSNLPDGAELMGWLSSGDYQAQDKQFLDGGTATFGPFSDKGSPLPSGVYDLSVSMSVARLQSAQVRAYIGEKGELMRGPFVEPATIEGEGNSLDFETTVTIP